MYSVLALAGPLLSCYFLLRVFRPSGPAERVLVFFCLLAAHIVGLGYLLSFANRLSDVRYWSLLGICTALVSAVAALSNGNTRHSFLPGLRSFHPMQLVTSVKDWYRHELSRFEKLLLTPLLLTVLLLGILDLGVVILTAPHNGDGMAYHLARMGYYLQQGNLSYFDANFSAQVLHPKNATLLLSYAYLVSGRNENALQLVQFISYWVAVCSVYAISRKAGNDRTRSVFAATVCGLLTEWLMQATTTQNDMILTAFFGVSAYALLASGRERRSKYLILAALGVGLALGTKATAFLPLVSIGLIASYALLTAKPRSLRRDSAILSASTLVAVCVFVLPSGYVDNYSRFGSPVGPQQVKAEHVFENAGQVAVHGTKNVFRYGFDFLKLDGLPRFGIVRTTQTIMRAFPKRVVRALGVDLESPAATVAPFRYSKAPAAHEDRSQWGVLGFGLVWLAALLSMLGVIKSPAVRVLSIAAVLLFLFRVYVGPYDPWRGRHLITCALFAAPAVGALLPAKNGFVRAYLLLVVIVGCLSAVSAVVLRDDGGLVSFRDRGRACAASVFRLDRIGQLTRNDTSYCEAIRRYDSLVPSNATVAVSLLGGSYEYPLFGRRLTRTIIPVNSFEKGLQPIPSTADYLLYEPDAFPCASPDDMHLGVDWYLRRLTGGTPVSAVSGSES